MCPQRWCLWKVKNMFNLQILSLQCQIIKIFEGKFTMNELTEISGGLPPMQLSHLFYLYDVPDSEGKMPTVEKAVEIYKEYVD